MYNIHINNDWFDRPAEF